MSWSATLPATAEVACSWTSGAHGQQVTIGAADGSAAVPRRRDPGPDGGYGIASIEALTINWVVHDHETLVVGGGAFSVGEVLAGGEVFDRSAGGGGGECGAKEDELVEDDQKHQQAGGAGDQLEGGVGLGSFDHQPAQ